MATSRTWYLSVLTLGLLGFFDTCLEALTSNSRNDPFPVYTTLDPQQFLHRRERLILAGIPQETCCPERLGFFLSPFGQWAHCARNFNKHLIPIGDINGRFNMLGLLFGPLPAGSTWPDLLITAREHLFPGIPLDTPIDDPFGQYLIPGEAFGTDIDMEFGFFSIPTKYQKRGLRWEWDIKLGGDFGMNVQMGVCDITQTVSAIYNLTPAETSDPSPCADNPGLTSQNVNCFLMSKLCEISRELCLNFCSYDHTGLEDLRINLFWRHAYDVNYCRVNRDWPILYIIPWASVGGIAALGNKVHQNRVFALSTGNNGHNAIGASGGLNIDFIETCEIGAYVGVTHFFERDYHCLHIPTACGQSGIFPWATEASVHPGNNWEFGAKIAAYQFLERLSGYFQYLWISHEHDKIHPKPFDPAWRTDILECRTKWKAQLANLAFTYDISPYISIGIMAQIPLSEQNAFKTTTLLASFNVIY